MSLFQYNSNRLFHFTSFKNGLKILASNKLKFGRFDNVNDIDEVRREYLHSDFTKKEADKYALICFSLDNQRNRIFSRNSLWGYYADKGNGLCLILNRQSFEREYLKLPAENRYRYRRVHYIDSFDNVVINHDEKDIFYTKSTDWKHENEIRYLFKSIGTNYIDISNCIEAVLICLPSIEEISDYLNSPEYLILKGVVDEKKIYRYTTSLGKKVIYQGKDLIWPIQNEDYDIDI